MARAAWKWSRSPSNPTPLRTLILPSLKEGWFPIGIVCVLDKTSDEVLDYFLTSILTRESGNYNLEIRSDSLGIIVKFDVTPEATIESITFDATRFPGQDLGIFKLGSGDLGQGLDSILHGGLGWLSLSKAEVVNWYILEFCMRFCLPYVLPEAIAFCSYFCWPPVQWKLCGLCLLGFSAVYAACVWVCYYYMSP